MSDDREDLVRRFNAAFDYLTEECGLKKPSLVPFTTAESATALFYRRQRGTPIVAADVESLEFLAATYRILNEAHAAPESPGARLRDALVAMIRTMEKPAQRP